MRLDKMTKENLPSMKGCVPVNISDDDSASAGLLAFLDEVPALKVLLGICFQELLRKFIVTYTPRVHDGLGREHILQSKETQI